MKINVAQQLKQPIGAIRSYEINETEPGGFPLQGEIKLLRTARGILVNGTVQTVIRSVCSRCLEEFDYPLSLDIEEEHLPTRSPASGSPLPASDEGSFTIDENHMIDLSEVVRQYTQLALPMKPVCRQDCAGLCPDCGSNLNYRPCNCSQGQPVHSGPRARSQ